MTIGSTQPNDDVRFMTIAIDQARASKGEDQRTHPRVGVVVVRDGQILASAYRGELAGGEHAEFTALERKLCDSALVGATVYTTLEPCTTRNHPKVACAHRLLERRVSRVVIGMLDPNPHICGRGIWLLRDARVVTDFFPDTLMSEVEELNRDFTRFHRPPARFESSQATSANAKLLDDPPPSESALMRAEPETKGESELLIAMVDAFFDKKFDEGKRKFDELAALIGDDSKRKRLEVIYNDLLYRGTANDAAFKELMRLGTDADVGSLATGTLGEIAILAADYETAIENFGTAANSTKDDEGVAHWLMKQADTCHKIGDAELARRTLLQALSKNLGATARATVLIMLAKVIGEKWSLMRAALLSKAAQLVPADASKRFDAAYALSREEGLSEVALSHYDAVLRLDGKHRYALNNLAVQCRELGMKGKAVSLFQRAFTNGEALAAANIASSLLEVGFFKEARELLSEAEKCDDVHQNVSSAKITLAQLESAEDQRWSEAVDLAVKQQLFISGFAEALLHDTTDGWRAATWTTHDKSDATFDLAGDMLVCEWGDVAKPNRRRMTLTLTGNAASLSTEKWQSYRSGGGEFFTDFVKGAAYLNREHTEIKLMLVDNHTSSFLTWKAKPKVLPHAELKQLTPGDS